MKAEISVMSVLANDLSLKTVDNEESVSVVLDLLKDCCPERPLNVEDDDLVREVSDVGDVWFTEGYLDHVLSSRGKVLETDVSVRKPGE